MDRLVYVAVTSDYTYSYILDGEQCQTEEMFIVRQTPLNSRTMNFDILLYTEVTFVICFFYNLRFLEAFNIQSPLFY